MKLSTKTRYGVSALFDIGYHATDTKAVQAKDVARREHIPLRYLEQILQELKKAGLVDSKRGPRGGYTIKKDASQILLSDVVRALQGPMENLLGFSNDDASSAHSSAVTNALWLELADHVAKWLDDTSLADLVDRAQKQGIPRETDRKLMYFI